MDRYTHDLLQAAKAGDVGAFEHIYRMYKDKIYALCLSTLRNTPDAEDATQQTFMQVYEKLGTLNDLNAFNTWIQRIAINESNMLLRKRKGDVSMDDETTGALVEMIEDDFMLPQEYAERDDLSRRLREIIDDLPAVQRQALVLQMYSNMSITEIAQIMNCSENTVKSRLRYAKEHIKTEIEERERKSGDKFFGVMLLPFGTVFTRMVQSRSMPPYVTERIWGELNSYIANVAGSAAGGTGGAAGAAAAKAGMSTGLKVALGVFIGSVVISGVTFGAVYGITHSKNAATPDSVAPTAAIISELPTEAPTEASTEPPTEAPTEPDNAKAYESYLELLEQGESDIRAYNWQLGTSVAPRPIAFADVCGDPTPEMIVASAKSSYQGQLSVYTYKNGSVSAAIQPETVDVMAGSGTSYYLYTVDGLDGFFCNYGIGDAYASNTVDHYYRTDSGLSKTEVLYMRDDNSGSTYRVNGDAASQETYVATLDNLLQNSDHLLMKNAVGPVFDFVIKETFDSMTNEAMTYDEAVAFLKNQAGSSAASASPYDADQQAALSAISGVYSQIELGTGRGGCVALSEHTV